MVTAWGDTGFNPDIAVQSEDTVRGMALGAGLVPAVIFLGAMLIMATYPLTEANRQLRHEQLQLGEIPTPAPTARDSHPMTTQSPGVPPKNDDDAPSA